MPTTRKHPAIVARKLICIALGIAAYSLTSRANCEEAPLIAYGASASATECPDLRALDEPSRGGEGRNHGDGEDWTYELNELSSTRRSLFRRQEQYGLLQLEELPFPDGLSST
jgi:hypothetical protein